MHLFAEVDFALLETSFRILCQLPDVVADHFVHSGFFRIGPLLHPQRCRMHTLFSLSGPDLRLESLIERERHVIVLDEVIDHARPPLQITVDVSNPFIRSCHHVPGRGALHIVCVTLVQ